MSETPEEREIAWYAVVETEDDANTPEHWFGPGTRGTLLIKVREYVQKHLHAKGQEMPPKLRAALKDGKDYYDRVLGLRILYRTCDRNMLD